MSPDAVISLIVAQLAGSALIAWAILWTSVRHHKIEHPEVAECKRLRKDNDQLMADYLRTYRERNELGIKLDAIKRRAALRLKYCPRDYEIIINGERHAE